MCSLSPPGDGDSELQVNMPHMLSEKHTIRVFNKETLSAMYYKETLWL